MKSYWEYEQEFFGDLPHGTECLKGMRRAIDAALEQQDFRNAMRLYHEFFRESSFYDDKYDSLLVLPECAALFDAHPELWDWGKKDMMWTYKWCVGDVQTFYQISRAQIENMLEMYRSFCDRFGYGKKTYYEMICKVLEDIDPCGTVNGLTIAEARERMSHERRDSLSDCRACELDTQIKYTLLYDDDVDKALQLARPLFQGRLTCAEVPHATYARFARYYIEKGQGKQAEEFADKAWRLIGREDEMHAIALADYVGGILLAYAYANPKKGVAVFKRTFAACGNNKNSIYLWEYLFGVYHLMQQLEQTGRKRFTLRLPEREGNVCSVADVKEYAANKLQFLTEKLDERDGNTLYHDKLSREFHPVEDETPVDPQT